MFFNVYNAALETGVPRVIMASSVHADDFHTPKDTAPISPDRIPTPDSPYGAHKVFMEATGRYYATKGLEVVCIRFGGINRENTPPVRDIDVRERGVWFSHRDCVSLIKSILEAKTIPDNFALIYGMSNNADKIHDVSNPFGWRPQDSAE
jgi:uronate dehydrogenase